MIVIDVRNVHRALPTALDRLKGCGVERDSRNGPVVQFPEPVTIVYRRPEERVMFWPARDANPFFHLMESLWMLAGRNDVEFPAQFVKRMRKFSDDGETFHGAYGHRWRHWFGRDQLDDIVGALRKNPECRRQVLSMWDATADLGRSGKDLPCNLQAAFQVAPDERLDMTVTNRSNDLIWGAAGANAVHFSMLHEYMAKRIGVPQGVYRQVSANMHAYVDTLEQVKGVADAISPHLPEYLRWTALDPYSDGEVEACPLGVDEWWEGDLLRFMTNPESETLHSQWFKYVAQPMFRAHKAYKSNVGRARFDKAREELYICDASDWTQAANEWLDRREIKWQRAADDGVRYE